MNVQDAYNAWSSIYDSNENKTRDLEAIALQKTVSFLQGKKVLEIGCGTGKNTVWLATKASHITAVDFTQAMLEKAKQKLNEKHVHFTLADINLPWHFVSQQYDLITFSLVLEHIQNLDAVFIKAAQVISQGGYIYVGELHPFKQYAGSKARYMTDQGEQVVTCFNHHVSDFTNAAKKVGFELMNLEEWFDNDDHSQIPRILSLLFQKK